MRDHSYENDFDLHENESAGGTHFQMNGFALRLVLKQRHKGTRKLPNYREYPWILFQCPKLVQQCEALRHLNKVINEDFCFVAKQGH